MMDIWDYVFWFPLFAFLFLVFAAVDLYLFAAIQDMRINRARKAKDDADWQKKWNVGGEERRNNRLQEEKELKQAKQELQEAEAVRDKLKITAGGKNPKGGKTS